MQLEVDALQAEAANARAAAETQQAAVTEVERLGQDNALLAARLAQMDLDLQVQPLTTHTPIFTQAPVAYCASCRCDAHCWVHFCMLRGLFDRS